MKRRNLTVSDRQEAKGLLRARAYPAAPKPKRRNPDSAAQYRLAQAVMSGTARAATTMTKEAAQEIISKTPAKLRSLFSKQNPAVQSAEAFEGFHGYPSGEIIELDETLHFHENLWSLGELISLTIKPAGPTVKLDGFGGAVLAANESRNQLFIKGGDQYVDLDAFGIPRDRHELELLGLCKKVVYYTTKTHLGKDGGEANYHHLFAEEHTDWSELPTVLYDTVNKRLSFAGGSYTIPDEGITD